MDSTGIRGIHRVGDEIVNTYLVEESGFVTIVDAGVPGYWSKVRSALHEIGRDFADVKAILLTHGHTDHVGFAERGRSEMSWPVMIHELDAALARGEVPNPAKGAGAATRIGPTLAFLWWMARHGGLRQHHLVEVATFGDGATLDVPGSPRVIHVPGHTPGSAALCFADRGAVMVGDAMAMLVVTSGQRGPQVAAFTADREQALASLSRIEALDARYVLPGLGAIWTEGAAAAVERVRAAAQAERPTR